MAAVAVAQRSKFLRLFGNDIPIPNPKDDTTNGNNPKKKALIEIEPASLDDHHDRSRKSKKQKRVIDAHDHSRKSKKQKRVIGASTPIYHFVPHETSKVLRDMITSTMGGKEIDIIIEKSLEKTDMDSHQARLSLPRSRIPKEFLTKEERDLLERGEKLPVLVIDPALRTYNELSLGKWYHSKKNKKVNNHGQSRGFSYVLKTAWNKLRDANKSSLKESARIQVWSFRVQDRLGLAILKI